MAQLLIEVLLGLLSIYVVFRVTRRAMARADMKQKMEQVNLSEQMAADIASFRKEHPKKGNSKKIKDFLDDQD